MEVAYHQLPVPEQGALWSSLQNGDERAKERLIALNYGLVHRLAQHFQHPLVDRDDLFQAGVVGLIEAVERFDPERGANFAAYAVPYIKGEMCRFLENRRGIKHRSANAKLARLLRETENRLTQELQRLPTVQELSEDLGVDTSELLLCAEGGEVLLSFGEEVEAIGDDDDGFDFVEDKLLAASLLEGLNERERLLVTMHFFENKTQSELAAKYDLSQAQISRLLRGALEKMEQRALSEE